SLSNAATTSGGSLPDRRRVVPDIDFSGIVARRSYLPFITGLGDGTTLNRTARTAGPRHERSVP
ncbi:hypothetical protein, partial [Bradyrhizobium sp. P5_C11_2]